MVSHSSFGAQLSADVLAFDTTNFDRRIATTTPGELARRGHAKSKRRDLRVVGLAALVSETGHVPLLHRSYPGNGSEQSVLAACLDALGKLHDALDDGEQRSRPACRTLVRDLGSWSPQLELDLDVEGYYSLISLPLSHGASQWALEQAARRAAMKRLGGKLGDVRAVRLRTQVGELERTLVVVESQELLRGQKRGIVVALRQAKVELRKLERRAASGRIQREALQERVRSGMDIAALNAPNGLLFDPTEELCGLGDHGVLVRLQFLLAQAAEQRLKRVFDTCGDPGELFHYGETKEGYGRGVVTAFVAHHQAPAGDLVRVVHQLCGEAAIAGAGHHVAAKRIPGTRIKPRRDDYQVRSQNRNWCTDLCEERYRVHTI